MAHRRDVRSPLLGHRPDSPRLTRTYAFRGAARFLSRQMMSEPSIRVREAAADQLELRQEDWYYNKLVVGVGIVWNVAVVAAAVVVAVISWGERPVLPLRLWVGGHVMQCLVHVSMVCVEYWRRQRRRLVTEFGGGWGLVPPSLPFLLGDDAGRRREGEEVIGVVKSANTIFSVIWWIIGFYWISTAGDALIRDAPHLYWLCVVFLSLDIFFVAFSVSLVCVTALTVCFCLPFMLGILSSFSDQSEGVSDEHIHQLVQYKFERDGKPDKSRGESQGPSGGRMIECGGKKSHHYISPEDAMCCICYSAYVNGDKLRRLPCSPIGHHFHLKCIDRWLLIKSICPLCKSSVLTNTYNQIATEVAHPTLVGRSPSTTVMVRPPALSPQGSIGVFTRVTGASEVVAIQQLTEHNGDLIRAINAHLNERDADIISIHSGVTGSSLGTSIENSGRESEYDQGTIITDNGGINSPLYHANHARNSSDDTSYQQHPGPRARFDDANDCYNDLEEEMVKAAIEASKQNVDHHLSARLAERERTRGNTTRKNRSLSTTGPEVAGRRSNSANGRRQIFVQSENGTSSRSNFEEERPLDLDEIEEIDERPLVRQRSRHISSRSRQAIRSPSSAPCQNSESNPVNVGHTFHADEWAGISLEERDEAVMLEAAIFGRMLEESASPSGYSHHQANASSSNSSSTFHPRMSRPPSSRLMAERLLREQQDDEYLAALLADQEKELKAKEEAEHRNLEEAAAREAVLEKQRQEEEENCRKQLEEKELDRNLAAKEASFPQEPSVDDENAVTLLVRMPDGSRIGRRFLKSDRLQILYDYIDIGKVVKPGSYRLVRAYPRHTFTNSESNLTLSELGFNSRQEALFLEII